MTSPLPPLSWQDLRRDTAAELTAAGMTRLSGYLDPSQKQVRRALARRILEMLSGSRIAAGKPLPLDTDDALIFLFDQLLGNRAPPAKRNVDWLFRPYNQLSCTDETVRRRLSVLESHADLADPILLIGDDDMQSVALAGAGFNNVTVVEIDARVCAEINERTKRLSGGAPTIIRSKIQDVSSLPGAAPRFILMDPPCEPDGFDLFLEGAVHLSGGCPNPTIFINTCLRAYGEAGLQRVLARLERASSEVPQVIPRFNRYPLPALPRLALNGAVFAFEPRLPHVALDEFVSDLMIVRLGARS